MNVLEAHSIQKKYGATVALSDGSLTCKPGEIVGLLGANGSGKSTFSKVISGVISPTSGTILFQGEELRLSSPKEAKEKGIIMVHQHLSLIPELTVWENIILGDEKKNKANLLDDHSSKRRAEEAMLNLCSHISINEKVKNLSISEKQLVEITKAIAKKPKLLLLDEPTACLEIQEVQKLFAVMEDLKRQGVAIIFTSHRLWEVTRICDFVVVFRNGMTVGEIDFRQEGRNEKRIVEMITGNDGFQASKKYLYKKMIEEKTVLSVDNLSLTNTVEDIQLTLKKGEILGLSGLQGQGQEELLLILSGLLNKSEGTIQVNEKEVILKHPKDAIREGMIMVPGDRHKEGLFLTHSTEFNLLFPQIGKKKFSYFLNTKKIKAEAQRLIQQLAIVPSNEKKLVKQLSGGNQQKIVVGKWIPLAPKVVLLNDPAKGVDVKAKEELYQAVLRLVENGSSVILYATDNEELISMCDRVLVMFEGKIVEELSGEQINKELLVSTALRASS